MKPQQLDSIERAIVAVEWELFSLGLDGTLSLSDIEALLIKGYSTSDIVDHALGIGDDQEDLFTLDEM